MTTPTLTDGILQATKFLLVDDEPTNIRILEQMLEQWQCFNVMSTTQSREALNLFQSFNPDIILLDLMMPELDGFEVMKQLKPLIPTDTFLPIVVLTADVTQRTKRKALAAGAKDFLTKPFDNTELSLRIFNLVETRHYYFELQKEKQLLQENVQQLRAAETMRDDLAHRLAHDLQAPLAAFLSSIQSAESSGVLNTEQRESMKMAVDSGRALLDIVSDLLNAAKGESTSV